MPLDEGKKGPFDFFSKLLICVQKGGDNPAKIKFMFEFIYTRLLRDKAKSSLTKSALKDLVPLATSIFEMHAFVLERFPYPHHPVTGKMVKTVWQSPLAWNTMLPQGNSQARKVLLPILSSGIKLVKFVEGLYDLEYEGVLEELSASIKSPGGSIVDLVKIGEQQIQLR